MKNADRITIPTANMEQNSIHEFERTHEMQTIDTRVNVHVHSKRHRLADPDGLSVKWVLDAIAARGILPDDSAKEIKAVTFSQEKIAQSEPEITVVEIIWE